MAEVQARIITPQVDGKASLKAAGVSSQSDQSSNSSGCSQGGAFQYLPSGSELISVSAGANPVPASNHMNLLLVGSANSSASGSSFISGCSSVVSGNSNIQHSVNVNGDSMASSGAASLALPTSPMSFSSSNMNFPGSSGLSFSRSVMTPRNRIDAQQDPSVQPAKLLKVQPSQQFTDELVKQGLQTGGPPGSCQPLDCFLTNGPTNRSMLRFAGQGLHSGEHLQPSDQQVSQSLPYMVDRNDLLQQHQVRQNILERPCPMLAQCQETLHQQSQLMQAQILQQQCLLQQDQMLGNLAPQIQWSCMLQPQQHMQQQIVNMARKMANASSGTFTRRLMQYLQHQRTRPVDNNIQFWREFTSEYFTPQSRKRFCLSQCTTSGGRQPAGVFPQGLWRCEICGSSPSRGFEVGADVLPRLCKTKFDNGELEDLLTVDLPHEYKLSSGLTVLEYGKAVQESVFENLRVIWNGQLRLIFTQDLKILCWDFCAKKHEELLPRRAIVPQVNQLVLLASRCQAAMAGNMGNQVSRQDLQASCNMFASCTHQLGKSLEPSYVNELGFTKRFVRCIQIAEVVNSMKDLMDFSWEKGFGPIGSLQKFPRPHKQSADMRTVPMQLQSATTNVPMHMQSAAMAQYLAESNGVFLNTMPRQMSPLGKTVSGQINALPSLQAYLRCNSNSFIQSDHPLIMKAASGSSALSRPVQASPSSSLTSLQSSVTSFGPNQLALRDVDGISAQQRLQGIRSTQLMAGDALGSSNNPGNETDNGMQSGTATRGSGQVFSGSISGIRGCIGGLPNNPAANNTAGSGINMGLQHLDHRIPQFSNTGMLTRGGLGNSVSQLGNAGTLFPGGLLNLDSLVAESVLDQTEGFDGDGFTHLSYG